MSSEEFGRRRYSWRPDSLLPTHPSSGCQSYPLEQWLLDGFGDHAELWLLRIFSTYTHGPVLELISRHDAPAFVALLYPRHPELFTEAEPHPLHRPDGAELPLKARLSFISLCALTGAVKCLTTLLELGADPNGMTAPAEWNTLEGIPVLPLDCALYGGHGDCYSLLKLYGGETFHTYYDLPPHLSKGG